MNCPNCGAKLNANSKFCTKCGMKLNNEDGNRQDNFNSQVNRSHKPNGNKIIYVVLAIILLGVLGGGYYFGKFVPDTVKSTLEKNGFEGTTIVTKPFSKNAEIIFNKKETENVVSEMKNSILKDQDYNIDFEGESMLKNSEAELGAKHINGSKLSLELYDGTVLWEYVGNTETKKFQQTSAYSKLVKQIEQESQNDDDSDVGDDLVQLLIDAFK